MPVDPQAAALLEKLPLLSTGTLSAQELRERMAGFGDAMRCVCCTAWIIYHCVCSPGDSYKRCALTSSATLLQLTAAAQKKSVCLLRLHANSGRRATSCLCGKCGTPQSLGRLVIYLSASTVQRPPTRGLRRGWCIFTAVRLSFRPRFLGLERPYMLWFQPEDLRCVSEHL